MCDDSSREKKSMFDGLTIAVALITAALGIVTALLQPAVLQVAELASGTVPLTFLCIWTLGSLPLAFAIPRLRAAFFGRLRDVPPRTYVLPRRFVRLCVGASFGQVLAFLVMAFLKDYRLLWLVGSSALTSGAFMAGARRRFMQDPNSELTMRWWPTFR